MLVTKTFHADAAHRLPLHAGLCKNLHGHRYVFEVTVAGDVGNDAMVCDFGAFGKLVKGWIDSNWDHALLADRTLDAQLVEFAGNVKGWRIYCFDSQPTIEAIVAELAQAVDRLAASAGEAWRCAEIRGYETPSSWATWRRA